MDGNNSCLLRTIPEDRSERGSSLGYNNTDDLCKLPSCSSDAGSSVLAVVRGSSEAGEEGPVGAISGVGKRKGEKSSTLVSTGGDSGDGVKDASWQVPESRRKCCSIQCSKKARIIAFISVLIVFAVIISIALVVIYAGGGHHFDETTSPPAQMRSSNRQSGVLHDDGDHLNIPIDYETQQAIDTILSGISDPNLLFDDPSSPQYQARQWILHEDLLRDVALLQGDYRVAQRYILAEFYYATGGDGGSSSLSQGGFLERAKSECIWKGVVCDSGEHYSIRTDNSVGNDHEDQQSREVVHGMSEEKILRLNFSGLDLTGSLQPELKHLSFLRALHLDANNFYGQIPEAWFERTDTNPNNSASNVGYWQDLYYLDLSENQLEGAIPADLWNNMRYLRYVYLHDNYLSGPIVRRNDYAEDIFRSHGDGTDNPTNNSSNKNDKKKANIPTRDSLKDKTNTAAASSLLYLQDVWLHNNTLSGSIPTWFLELPNLETLILNTNSLTGRLPAPTSSSRFSSSLPPKLSFLDMSSNGLTGQLPNYLFESESLTKLYMDHNEFNGTLPAGEHPSILDSVWLNDNNLQGTIPETFGMLWSNLTSLRLEDNNLSGTIDDSKCNSSWPNIELLEADCIAVQCSCCTNCY